MQFLAKGPLGILGDVSKWLGAKAAELFIGDESPDANVNPQIVSPQERTAKTIEENRTKSEAEITIKTEPGTNAEVSKGKLGGGLKLQPSGNF